MTASGKNLSPNQRARQRLLKNKPAVFGLFIIAITLLIAILGYLITPDSSPNANEQITELALKNPRFTIQLLKIRKNREVENNGWIKTMFFGQPNPFKLIPLNKVTFKEDSVSIERYSGEKDNSGMLRKGKVEYFHFADVIFPISSEKNITINNGKYIYFDFKGNRKTISRKDAITQIENEHIINRKFYLGTDRFGRSMLSRLILGVRISLLVGFIAVFISLTIGILLGAVAGFFGGRVDDLIMLLINTVWSIPTLLLVFAIVLALGRGIGIIFLAVGLTMWVDVARIVRGQVMIFKTIQFVEAAKSMGFQNSRIIIRHILPNILGPVMVIAAANFATAILIEAGLSYLGFGIQPPTPSWGTMLNENYGYAIGGKPFLAIIPAFAIMLLVLAFNLIGNGLRDALDVK